MRFFMLAGVLTLFASDSWAISCTLDSSCSNWPAARLDSDCDGYCEASGAGRNGRTCCVDSTIYSTYGYNDCEPGNGDINPGAPEGVGDNVDSNCDTDELCYIDSDRDAFGELSTLTSDDTDCSDTGEATTDTDCNDNDSSVNPGELESPGNSVDENCDDVCDCYEDIDGDGYGATSSQQTTLPAVIAASGICTSSCDDSTNGLANDNTDCDDVPPNGGAIHWGASEVCDGLDNNCAFGVDDADPNRVQSSGTVWGLDEDGDGYVVAGSLIQTCTVPLYYIASSTARGDDCSGYDNDPNINPGMLDDDCDLVDDDCDGSVDENHTTDYTLYLDDDGDTFGTIDTSIPPVISCMILSGYSRTNDDCNDSNGAVHPSATEVCDGQDNDCNGTSDDDDSGLDLTSASTWYFDYDEDSVGDSATTAVACDQPSGYTPTDGDCDDNDSSIYPGADELCDGKNNACINYNGSLEWISDPYDVAWMPAEEADEDQDGYLACCDYGVYELSTSSINNDRYGDAGDEPARGLWGGHADCMPNADAQELGAVSTERGDSSHNPPISAGGLTTLLGGGDCDDTDGTLHPFQSDEACECVGDQIDQDCNGSVSTMLDANGNLSFPSGASSPTCPDDYFLDCDGDGEGADPNVYTDGSRGPFALCDATDSVAIDLLSICNGGTLVAEGAATDCDDDSDDVGVRIGEVCDGIDNNCNTSEDEVSYGLDDEGSPAVISPEGCDLYYLDADDDGQGGYVQLCLCASDAPNDCTGTPSVVVNFDLPGFSSLPPNYWGQDPISTCYVLEGLDCNDDNSEVYRRPEPYELMDGADNDCDFSIPFIELDCDLDGYVASGFQSTDLVVFSDQFLADCAQLEYSVEVPCWDDTLISVFCYQYTDQALSPFGLYSVNTSASVLDDYINPDTGRVRSNPRAGGDCDDRCALRNPGLAEECDGLDNNCDGLENLGFDANRDGIPDANQTSIAGQVDIEELDLDGDGYLICNGANQDMDGQAFGLSARSCADSEPGYGDPDDFCHRSMPGVEEDLTCDGILAYEDAEVAVDGSDPDRDEHLECGVNDISLSLEDSRESVFVLVYGINVGATDADADTGDIDSGDTNNPGDCAPPPGDFVPLITPRIAPSTGEVASCDATLDQELRALIALVHEDPGTLDDYLWRDPREDRGPDPLLDVCILAQLCAEWPETDRDMFCSSIPEGASCAVVELAINNSGDGELAELLLARDSVAEGDLCTRARLGEACVDDPTAEEQLILRSVWSQERIIESRRRVVEWECFRMRGTYGCGDLDAPEVFGDWRNPYTTASGENLFRSGGHFTSSLSTAELQNDPRWWKEIGRYGRPSAPDDCLAGCWGNPFPELNGGLSVLDAVSPEVGGDCADGGPDGHRDALEGPGDLLGLWVDDVASCETCLDGLDNNCNGLADCEDPACDVCFVGRGMGCGASEDSPCAESGCATAGSRTMDRGALAGLVGLIAGLGALALRRRQR